MKKFSFVWIFFILSASVSAQKIVRYDLYVNDTMVNYSGKNVMVMAVNGLIPLPTLYFSEGDTAEIYFHNMLNEPTAFH